MRYINLHTHFYTQNDSVLEVVNQYPWEFTAKIPQFSIGIHPWYIEQERLKDDIEVLTQKIIEKKCLALGECGLDKRIETSMALQAEVFQQQLELIKKTSKPIIVHCVAAYQEVIAIKKEMGIENPMIIHGFSKNKQVARSLLDNGFYLSFGKYLLQNPDLKTTFQYVPDDLFFLETDTIEETIFDVYRKAAEIKEIQEEVIKEQIEHNFQCVFK